jgi:hypothetical protein
MTKERLKALKTKKKNQKVHSETEFQVRDKEIRADVGTRSEEEGRNGTENEPQESFYQIYDRIIKRIITLSPNAVINLINALFQTNYPPGSKITYNWTEHHDNNLERTIADTIITINNQYTYHIEVQAYKDEAIEFRVFDYSYKHALTNRGYMNVLRFPEPKIIYLYSGRNIPDEEIIMLDFGMQGTFDYHIPVFKLVDRSPRELDELNMIILIPFSLLRLRKQLEKSRSEQDINDLQSLIFHDILGLIKKNLRAGNITAEDANQLWSMVVILYRYLYAKYKELAEGVTKKMEDRLVLDYDLIKVEMREEARREAREEVEKEVREEVEKKVREEVAKEVREEVRDEVRGEIVDEERNAMIKKLYFKLNDSRQVAALLDLSVESVQAAI